MKMKIRALAVLVCLAALAAPMYAASYRANFPSPQSPNAPAQNVAIGFTPCSVIEEDEGMAGPYPCKRTDLQYFMPLADVGCGSAANLWGWTDPDTDKEYALLGCNNGTSFIDITNPTAPVYLGRLPAHGANSSWRDVRTDGYYCFIGSEASNHGIQVFDLRRLRNVPSPPATFTEDAHYAQLGRSHTIAVNEQANMLYAVGSQTGPITCGGDLHQINIADPLNPTFAGCVSSNGYIHETNCLVYTGPDVVHQGKNICFNSNGRFDNTDTLSINDVTNPAAPVQLSRFSYPSPGYAHQTWTTEDQQYLLLDDEFDEQDYGFPTRTLIFNISDLENPILIGTYLGSTPAVDHNQYVRGRYAFQSNYRAGLRVIDLKNIATANLSEWAYFDIYPSDDAANYNGAWGNYPFFASGNVIISGIEQGLFIVKPKFLPKLAVNDISVVEGAGFARFTISLSAVSTQHVYVNYTTADGTALAGEDYVANSGQIVIAPGETFRSKEIGVVRDNRLEGDETFFLNLTTSNGAEIEKAQGVATIIDDDTPVPTLSIADVAINEGEEGITQGIVNVTLNPTSSTDITVDFATTNGVAPDPPAEAGTDYSSVSGTLTFPAGSSGPLQIIVPINGDYEIEDNEVLYVDLSNTSAALPDPRAKVTLINDDVLSVTSLAPTSGPAAGGTDVTVNGTRFSPTAAVHFGEAESPLVTFVSQAQIIARTPAMPAGSLVAVDVHNTPHGPIGQNHPVPLLFMSDFLDVPASHLFHNFVEKIFRAGITSGCGNGNYCPDAQVSRQQMAVFLVTAKFGTLPPPDPVGIFEDVPVTSPFARWVERLYNLGVTAGCSSSPLRYCPTNPVTRAQMAVFLLATLEGNGYTPPPAVGLFADVPITSPFAPWIEELANRGITAGCGGGNYCPTMPVTRGQMSALLVGTFSIP